MTNPDVLNFILEAKSIALENFDDKNFEFRDVMTIVKPIKGIKKRPKLINKSHPNDT